MTPENILPTYDRIAREFARNRDNTLFERRWLDRMLAHAPGRNVLDLGCGSGRPIATYLADRRCQITGVDGAAAMVKLFAANLPEHKAIHADMRGLDLGKEFDAVIAWDSFFHLSAEDQQPMFATFARHLAPRGVLLFTSGHMAGEALGEVEGETVFHASLDPEEYRALMDRAGLDVISFISEDPQCQGHSVWLARKRPATA